MKLVKFRQKYMPQGGGPYIIRDIWIDVSKVRLMVRVKSETFLTLEGIGPEVPVLAEPAKIVKLTKKL